MSVTDVRTGEGFDTHRFEGAGPVRLAGVEVAHDQGLAGHSDADVVAHAVMDALLGAAGRGDIGEHFPDTDPAFAGADSMRLLADVAADIAGLGWTISNVDATVLCERPRIAAHRASMRANLAGALGVDEARVNVKATTTEGLGFLGRAEGIACLAVATLVRH